MVLGRHPFSIPLSVVVGAPADIVWKVLTDIESYPRTYSGIAVAERAGHVKGGARNANGPSKDKGGNGDLLGSQWNVTRVSVVEGQRYSTKVTVTRVEGAGDGSRRSFTQSTDLILGATCSLKLIVEPAAVEDAADSTAAASSADGGVGEPKDDESDGRGEGSTVGTAHSTRNSNSASPPSPERCRVTAILTMIPHSWCTRILGILCCPCLLQSRARTAMERDLEDLARVCEEKSRERRPASGEGEGDSALDLVVQSQREQRRMDDADVAGGSARGEIRECGDGASPSAS